MALPGKALTFLGDTSVDGGLIISALNTIGEDGNFTYERTIAVDSLTTIMQTNKGVDSVQWENGLVYFLGVPPPRPHRYRKPRNRNGIYLHIECFLWRAVRLNSRSELLILDSIVEYYTFLRVVFR